MTGLGSDVWPDRYAQEKQQVERQRLQAQLQGAEAKEAVRQALAAELGREREEAEEMDRIRQELAEEEMQDRERQREKRDMEVGKETGGVWRLSS